MAAQTIEVDYPALNEVASMFGDEADDVRATLRRIVDQAYVLRAGAWMGLNADVFLQALDNDVVPALERLVSALSEASDSTHKISSLFRDAEEAAAAEMHKMDA